MSLLLQTSLERLEENDVRQAAGQAVATFRWSFNSLLRCLSDCRHSWSG